MTVSRPTRRSSVLSWMAAMGHGPSSPLRETMVGNGSNLAIRSLFRERQESPDTIEKTHVQHWLARGGAAVAAKRERLAARGPLRGFLGTVPRPST
jgi:hypothetical protein